MTFTYITTCKSRLGHLKQTLPRVANQPGIECVVVDYNCPEGTADWVAAAFPSVRVVRVANSRGFNASHARNLGAEQASGEWLGFFDADILLSPDFGQRVLPKLCRGTYYRPHPLTYQTWGSVICRREDFLGVGGYDEAYVGWGGEDDDLVAMLQLHGVRPAGFPGTLLDEIPHGDGERTLHCEIQNRWTQSRINQLYFQAKLDLMRLYGRLPDESQASALFIEIQRSVMAAESAGQDDYHIDVHLPATVIGSPAQDQKIEPAQLQKTIRYAVRIMGQVPDPGIRQTDVPCI